MKMNRSLAIITAATVLAGLAFARSASGAPYAAVGEKVYQGNVTRVDTQNRIVSVRKFLLTRNFHLAKDAKVTLQDKPQGSLSELRPGQQVDIRYNDDDGVCIARLIAQHNLAYSGHITSIDVKNGTLLVRHNVMTREFAMPSDCEVRLRQNKNAGLNSLQLGDAVTVVYERGHNPLTARRIEEYSTMFTGTIEAVDLSTRTIKTRGASGERQFSLADNCAIVINGSLNNSMDKLVIGEQATVNYNNVDGVLVADRISPAPAPMPAAPKPAETAQQNVGSVSHQ